MNSYELSRNFWDWSFDNPEKVRPIHAAIYFFSIEHCNRLGWKQKFGLPSQMVMEAIGVKNWKTYSKGLEELVEFGFLEMIEKSRNQYSSNIIAIVNFTKADGKALTKALSKHTAKHSQSTVSINKPNNQEPINIYPTIDEFVDYAKDKAKELGLLLDIIKVRAKYMAWSADEWYTGGKSPRKIKNWKSTLVNSLHYLKAEPAQNNITPDSFQVW